MTKVRVGVVVAGKFRRLLSLAENKKGEVVVGIQSAENYQYGLDGTKILHQKYTVHASLDSDTYNTITHTLVLSDGRKLRSYSVTDAIKSKSGFAMLFARRCPDLSNDRYLLKNSKKFIPVVLSSYDPVMATPVFAVFVGSIDTKFKATQSPDFAVTEIPLSKVKLVIIHGAIALPSHRTGDLMHAMTFKPESAPPQYQAMFSNMMKGWDSDTCMTASTAIFMKILGHHIRFILKNENLGAEAVTYLHGMLQGMGQTTSPDEEEGPDQILALTGLDRPPSASQK
jgi:hypothetical protein